MNELPQDVLVMISDEAAAGRIVVELGAFVRLNVAIDEQLSALESRMLREIPQLGIRRSICRTMHQSRDHKSPDHWSG